MFGRGGLPRGFAPRFGGQGGRGRAAGGELQLLMLAMMLWRQIEALPYKPPVTLAAIALMGWIFVSSPLDALEACFNPVRALSIGLLAPESIGRALASVVHHADQTHIYYNMTSFLLKGVTLEQRYGSERFAGVLVVLAALTQAAYIAICLATGHSECGVGFSGVIFALSTLCNVDSPGTSVIWGFHVPTKLAAWAELVLISLINPRVSFVGHLAGILAGLAFAYGERRLRGRADATFAAVMRGAFDVFDGFRAAASGGGWACAACTLQNEAAARDCAACGARRRGIWGSGVLGGVDQ